MTRSLHLVSITAVIKAEDTEEEEAAQSDTYSTLNLWDWRSLLTHENVEIEYDKSPIKAYYVSNSYHDLIVSIDQLYF